MNLNKNINNYINKYKYNIGVYAIDSKGTEIRVNEHKTFETASCIKLFILIEYYRQIQLGLKKRSDIFTYKEEDKLNNINSGIISTLEYGLQMTSKDYAILMIIVSDNIATNKLIDYLGIDNINNTIKELGFANTKLFNKIDFTKYKRLGVTTPYEYGLAFQKILNRELFSKKISDEIVEILKKQRNNDMLAKGMPLHDILFKGTNESIVKYIASKSGAIAWETDEIDNVRNDGGIISTIYGDYIISIFISGFEEMYLYYNNEAINCGSEIHKIIFEEYKKNNGGFINEMKNEHYVLLKEFFNKINKKEIKKILDAGSGKTSLSCLLNYFDTSTIDAIIFPGDYRKIKSIKKNIVNDNYCLIELDLCKNSIDKHYDLVLAHLLLGEASKWGNEFKFLLKNLVSLNSDYFIIYDLKEDPNIDYDYLENYLLNNNFKIIYKSQIVKSVHQQFDDFIGKTYVAYLFEKVKK